MKMKQVILCALSAAVLLLGTACQSSSTSGSSGSSTVTTTTASVSTTTMAPQTTAATTTAATTAPPATTAATKAAPATTKKPAATTKAATKATTTAAPATTQQQAAAPAVVFKNETVTEVYSLDYSARRYHKVTDSQKIKTIAAKLNAYDPPVSHEPGQVGFLIFTDKGKYDYYLSPNTDAGSETDKELAKLSMDCNALYPGVVQWLAYMSTSNIQRITFDGAGGYGFSLKEYERFENFDIDVDTNSKEEIQKISTYIKSILVEKEKMIADGEPNPKTSGDLYSMLIIFNTGVNYGINGYTNSIWVYSTDINQTIYYNCSEQDISGLRDLMMGLGSAKVTKW